MPPLPSASGAENRGQAEIRVIGRKYSFDEHFLKLAQPAMKLLFHPCLSFLRRRRQRYESGSSWCTLRVTFHTQLCFRSALTPSEVGGSGPTLAHLFAHKQYATTSRFHHCQC